MPDAANLTAGAALAVERPLLVILGPTASGKSDVALAVARRTGAELLSVDSMQVYRGMDVGTAKPSAAKRAAVRHHLIDVVEPDEPFTVARFVELADAVIRDAQRRGVPLVLTGGTPLYYKALFQGLFDGPGADDEVRRRLRALPREELLDRVRKADPEAAARIHRNDVKRLVRALEVFELTGRPISSFQTAWAEPEQRHRAVWVGLHWEKDALNRRINARVKSMMAGGWVEEVRDLLRRYGDLSDTARMATGYGWLRSDVRGQVGTEGRLPLDTIVEEIKLETRQLARRQMKWFRRFPGVTWVAGDQPTDAIAARVVELWGRQGDVRHP